MGVVKPKQIKPLIVASAYRSAEETIGVIEPGYRLVGLSKGQFSLVDLILAVNKQIGACHAMFSTWTTGLVDAERMLHNIQTGNFLSMQLLTDHSFPSRQPKYCKRFIEIFGKDSIVCTKTHAKFSLLRNDKYNIVIRGSMNLNRNPRCEQFDIDDDPAIYKLFADYVAEIQATMPHGFVFTYKQIEESLTASMGGGRADVYHDDYASTAMFSGEMADLNKDLLDLMNDD